jgi:hypothetical protein
MNVTQRNEMHGRAEAPQETPPSMRAFFTVLKFVQDAPLPTAAGPSKSLFAGGGGEAVA